jgi:hypothetical protein
MYVLVKLRSLRKPLLALLAILIVFSAAQFGPLATSASAEPRPENKHCPEPGFREPQYLDDGTVVWWRCVRFFVANDEYWVWVYDHTDFSGRTTADEYTFWRGGDNSPPYLMHLESVVADGRGGGDMVGSVIIFTPTGGNLDRRIAVHLQVQYKPTPTSSWLSCHPGSWREAASPRSWMKTAVAQYSEPDCGDGYYRSRVYGRFYSLSLGSWVRRGPIYTPSLWLDGPPVPTEPTVTPGPVTNPE